MNTRHRPVVGGALALLALALASCGGPGPEAGPELHLYTWADYVKPELVARFEREQGCRVVVDTFDSNEAMYAKLKAGATGYDVIVPSSYMVTVMAGQGLLAAIDRSRIPNLVHVDPDYLRIALDPDMTHSVPYMLTNTGIAWLKSKAPGLEPSWAAFDRPEVAGRATLLNDMRETIGAALKSLGYSLNTVDEAQLAEARDVVIRWKRGIAKFENEQYKSGLASGEFLLTHAYSGDILQVLPENPDIVFAVPREGTSVACDDLVIPRSARNPGLAHAWINFLHDPQVAAENTEHIQYLCPNKDAYPLLSEEFRSNPAVFMDPAVRARSEVIRDLGPDNAKYVRIWDEIKAAR